MAAPVAAAIGVLAGETTRRLARRDSTLADVLGRRGGPCSTALAVSDTGTVVGSAAGRPFRWQSGEWRWLLTRGAGVACGVDDYGEAVGWLQVPELGRRRPALWRRDAVRLLELPPGASSGEATALSQSGVAVGTVCRSDGSTVATTWRAGEVATLAGHRDDVSTAATAVAGSWIAGTRRRHGAPAQACLWANGALVGLDSSGVPGSVAHDVNLHGVVVGEMTNAAGRTRACRWTDGRLRDLGTLGGRSSVARAINDHGVIVGEAETIDGDRHACAWVSGDIWDLGTLGGTTSAACAVNDDGTVVGTASTGVGALGIAFRPGGWSWEEHAFMCRLSTFDIPGGLPS